MARPDPAGDVPALRPPLVDPKAHRGLTSLGSLLIDDTVGRGQPHGATPHPTARNGEASSPLRPREIPLATAGTPKPCRPCEVPRPSLGKPLPGTPSTRNLVVGVGAVEGVSYGDGVARVGLTRGVVYHQSEKANLNRLQSKKMPPFLRSDLEPRVATHHTSHLSTSISSSTHVPHLYIPYTPVPRPLHPRHLQRVRILPPLTNKVFIISKKRKLIKQHYKPKIFL